MEFEFRIWDNMKEAWVNKPSYDGTVTTNVLIGTDGDIIVVESMKGECKIVSWAPDQERFILSQYVGKKDTHEKKAFTGDIIMVQEGDYKGTVGEITQFEGHTYLAVNGVDRCVLPPIFTIEGNKWEVPFKKESLPILVTKQELSEICNMNNWIPYQLCPKCNGEAQISNTGISTSAWRTCPVCNGAKIIPMAKAK